MIHEPDETWTFQEGELPTWGATHANKTVPEFDFGVGVPAVTPEPLWPLFSRVMLVRITIDPRWRIADRTLRSHRDAHSRVCRRVCLGN